MDPLDELIAVLEAGAGAPGVSHVLGALPLTVYLTALDERATPRWVGPQVESMFGHPAASWSSSRRSSARRPRARAAELR